MTNILHLPTYVNKKKYYRALSIGIAIALILFGLKSCGTFDVTTSARMSPTSFNESSVVYASYEDTPKIYSIRLDVYQYKLVDSILWRVHNSIGYELTKKEADQLQSSVGEIIRYFMYQKQVQDTVKSVSKPKNKNQ